MFQAKKTVRPSQKKKKPNFFSPRNIVRFLLTLFIVFYLFLGLASFSQTTPEQIGLSEALEKIRTGQVEEVAIIDNRIELKPKEGEIIFTEKEPEISFTEILKENQIEPNQVKIRVDNQSLSKSIFSLAGTLLPLAFTGLIFWYIFRQAGRAQSSIFSFGKSKAKLFIKGKQPITFKDVAGLKETKEELREVVDFLKQPEKYRKMGARTPKGVLLVGPSGVGKTLLARAVAGEANVPFFSMAGSEFMEMLVGVGASRVRDLFSTAKKAAPAIIFIDELDAIGRMRGSGVMAGHDEREQTLNQILVEMDGFEPNERLVVVAATNRGDLLDSALLRPGRFDRRIVLTLPDLPEREEILKLHSKGKPFTKNVSWKKVAQRTVGFSGADLENMLNEAAILAARKNKTSIVDREIEEAALKVKLGPEKRRLQTEKEKQITAYHEAGHALVSFLLPEMDPIQRVSIVSRGLALGYTLISPTQERVQQTKSYLLAQITTLLGGRAAEELKFKEMTTGAATDIKQASSIVRAMVLEYGMSDLGPVNLGSDSDFSGWSRAHLGGEEISPRMRAEADKQVKQIVDQCYQQAKKLLRENQKQLKAIAQQLVKKETLSGEEIKQLLAKKKSVRRK